MRKGIIIAAFLSLILTACGESETADRAESIQERFSTLTSYSASVNVELPREDEALRYTLRLDKSEDGGKVTVLSPELLAGTTVQLDGTARKLEYDGVVLDAGENTRGMNAVNCAFLALEAAADGYLLERSEEILGDEEHALRLCFESECSGETLRYALWFAPDGTPLYAEIAENEKIVAFIEFTSFAFGDIISPNTQAKSDTEA